MSYPEFDDVDPTALHEHALRLEILATKHSVLIVDIPIMGNIIRLFTNIGLEPNKRMSNMLRLIADCIDNKVGDF